MASTINTSTGDLRSVAKQYQRDRNHNFKWARGLAPGPGKRCPHDDSSSKAACPECGVRPQHRDEDRRHGRHYSTIKHQLYRRETAQQATLARKVFRNELLDTGIGTSDSSAGEEDTGEACAAPVPDAEIMYSYDATHGPGKGADVLGNAVTKAIQRYEIKVTEKLVKEYEFIDTGKDWADGYTADADEDDFEMIDYANVE